MDRQPGGPGVRQERRCRVRVPAVRAEPEIAARIVNGVHYAGANKAALEKVDPAIRNDPAIYPPQEVLDRCEFIEDLGETTQLLDELWTDVKAN